MRSTAVKPKRKSRRRLPVWRTEIEWREITDKFMKMQEQGTQARDIARQLNVPLSSIYNRLKQANITHEQKALRWGTPRSVSAAIEILTRETASREDLLEALFVFIVWKRWPSAYQDHVLGLTTCVTSYLSLTYNSYNLDELPPSEIRFLLKYLRLDILRRICSPDSLDFPSFILYPFEGHDDFDFLGEIVNYFLFNSEEFENGRRRPSLNKAFQKQENGDFICTWRPSRRAFQKLWSENAAAAPFHFVERFHSSINFTLQPTDCDFNEQVDGLLSKLPARQAYFARCKWATETLQRTLDKRACANINFPAFPTDLTTQRVVCEAEIPSI